MPKLSGNKGEWSEIYAFLRLLEIKKLYAADAELNKKDDMFYNIINIIRTEPIGTLEFRINRTEDTKNKIELRMCGLLFEYDVRLSAKMYFTKSYMNIRTKRKDFANCRVLFR